MHPDINLLQIVESVVLTDIASTLQTWQDEPILTSKSLRQSTRNNHQLAKITKAAQSTDSRIKLRPVCARTQKDQIIVLMPAFTL